MKKFWNKYKWFVIIGSILLVVAIVIIIIVKIIRRKSDTDFTLGDNTRPNSNNYDIKASDWSRDSSFFTNSEGKNLFELAKSIGITLSRNKGLNNSFSEEKYKNYKTNPSVYWAVYDINEDKFLASSSNASKNLYGASVPKVCVAAVAFANNKGTLPKNSDYQKVIKLLVKSDNDVWTDVENIAGGGKAVNDWALKMGYTMKPARKMGNTSNAIDMCKFWNDVCRNKFEGAENIFKISSSCQTSSSRSKKCMPKDVYIGGKTGTYSNVNHDCCYIEKDGRFYSICVLTELGSKGSEAIAQMFRGLYNEYINK